MLSIILLTAGFGAFGALALRFGADSRPAGVTLDQVNARLAAVAPA